MRRLTVPSLLLVFAVACGTAPPVTGAGEVPVLLELDIAGAQALVAEQRGSPVLINLWASWCPPCRDEAPALAAAARRYGPRGVVFLGVDYQDDADGAREFIRNFDMPFPSIWDPSGRISAAFGLRGIPVTLILDADGNEVFRRVGSLTASELAAALESVVTT